MTSFNNSFDDSGDPFVDTYVALQGRHPSGPFKGTYKVCIMDRSKNDPLSDGSADSAVEMLGVYLPYLHWDRPEPPQTGDSLTLENGEEFSVTESQGWIGGYLIKARKT